MGAEVTHHDFPTEFATEAAKGAPPVVVTVGSLVGMIDINWWLAAATLFYVVMQSAYLIWKWRREADGGRK